MSAKVSVVYFVDCNNPSPLFNLAFRSLGDFRNIKAIKVSESDVLSKKESSKAKVNYVMSWFEGPVFEHLKAMDVTIFGPQVVLDYTRDNKPLPKWSVPLYSTALRGAVVCITSIEGDERKKAYESVKMLHGAVVTGLTRDVNVLIAPKVGSLKYIVANEFNINVLLPSWLDEAWKVSATQDPVNMLSAAYIDRFRLPIFCQLVICTTGFTPDELQKICGLVQSNGGEFSRELTVGTCTHLVVNKPSGVKYEYAKKWKIQTVTLQWVLDSVEKGYAQKEENYTILDNSDSKANSTSKLMSTPKSLNSHNSREHCDISAISVTHITDSRINLTTDDSCVLPNTVKKKPSKSIGYLRGCKIVLLGSKERSMTERLKSIVEANGGRIFFSIEDKVTENLTHAVVVNPDDVNTNDSFLKTIEKDPDISYYVSSNWLLACQSSNSRVDEKDYLIEFDREDKQKLVAPQKEDRKSPEINEDDIEMIQSYFQDMESDDFTGFGGGHNHNGSAVSKSLFRSSKFYLDDGLTEDERQTASEVISADDGAVVGQPEEADFHICPLIVRLPAREKSHQLKCKRVTFPWLNECIRQHQLIPVDNLTSISRDASYYQFIPVLLYPDSKNILSNCFMSVSGYFTTQRSHIIKICKEMGAVVQSCLTRKPAPTEGLHISTHLISASPSGDKYEYALKWGIPSVSAFWLVACAAAGRRLSESDYPVIDCGRMNESTACINESTVDCSKTVLLTSSVADQTTTTTTPRETKPSMPQIDRLRQTISGDTAARTSPGPSCEPQFVTPKSRNNVRVTPSGSTTKTPASLLNSSATSSMGTPWDQVTPGKYLTKGVPYIPKFDIPAMMAGLKTPDKPEEPENPETPLNILYERGITNAVEISNEFRLKAPQTTDSTTQSILSGCCICVAKYDSKIESEMYSLVNKLGGDFRWKYDEKHCTHLITSFKIGHDQASLISANSQNTPHVSSIPDDIEKAVKQKKFIVHPQWLRDCAGEFVHQPEGKYDPVQFVSNDEKENQSGSDKSEEPSKPSIFGTVMSLLRTGTSSNDSAGNSSSHLGQRRKNKRRRMGSNDPDNELGMDINVSSKKNRMEDDARPQPSQALEIKWAYDDNSCDKYFAENYKSVQSSVTTVITHQQVSKPEQEEPAPPTRLTRQSVKSKALDVDTPGMSRTDRPSEIPRIFMLTNLSDEERNEYADLISRLGGSVVEEKVVSDAVTHFITKSPTRSERFMVCLARGLWILHKSYLDACSKANAWVPEEGYEWGSMGTEPMLTTIEGPTAKIARDLARAAKRWRIRNGGAFKGWKAIIYAPESVKVHSFKRLIEAGGGTVLAMHEPYPKTSEVTHAFAEAKPYQRNLTLPREFEWITPDFMAAFLTSDPPPSPRSFSVSASASIKDRK